MKGERECEMELEANGIMEKGGKSGRANVREFGRESEGRVLGRLGIFQANGLEADEAVYGCQQLAGESGTGRRSGKGSKHMRRNRMVGENGRQDMDIVRN